MAYKYRKWTLYKAFIEGDAESLVPTFFFSRWVPKKGEAVDLPEGCSVELNERTGLPYLKWFQ